MKYCLVIPHYNHQDAFSNFLPRLMQLNIPCVIVDDGSERDAVSVINKLIIGNENIYFFEHGYNRGKGAAVITGAYHARSLGFTHIVQIDADGQHDINDIEKLIAFSRENPETIVSGKPYFDVSAPKTRVYGRRITDFWVALETLSLKIKDGLCGFRVYPLSGFEKIIDRWHLGVHMDFDTEILVKAVWLDIPLHFIATKVIYPENSISHFHYLRDNSLLIRLHIRLLLGMLIRSPLLLMQRLKTMLL